MKVTRRRTDLVWIVLLVLMTGMLVGRALLSFCQSDESFYAALVHRLWLGERLVVDEWNSAQFYAPLLLPWYGLYVLLKGSTEGAILFLRILYVAFAAVTSFRLFSLIRREGGSGLTATVSAMTVLLFSRANIWGVSYYNLCMLCVTSGCCLAAGASRETGRKRNAGFVRAGVVLAAGVLCDPFLTPVVLTVLVILLTGKRWRKDALWTFAGMAGLALLYCVYLLHGSGPRDILVNLKYVLDNPEKSSALGNLRSGILQCAGLSKFVAIPAVIMTAVLWLRRRGDGGAGLILPYLALQTVLMLASALRGWNGFCDVITIPMTVVALPFFLKPGEGRDRVPVFMYAVGLVNALAYLIASNTGVDAGTVGFCLSAAAGFWLCGNAIRSGNARYQGNRTDEEQRIAAGEARPGTGSDSHTSGVWMKKAVLLLMALCMLVPMFSQRVIGVYRDAPLRELNTRLTMGPAKGLYTTEAHALQYEAICRTLTEFAEEYPEGRILYCKLLPWAYLQTPYHYGAPSSWRIHTGTLETYAAVHPENRADYAVIFEEQVGGWERSALNRNPGVATPNAFDYTGEYWENVFASPVLKGNPYLRIYDLRGQ